MHASIANHRRSTLTRQVNSQLVMEAIIRDGPITRAALARQLALSKPTVSDIVRVLEGAGWVRPGGNTSGGLGRSGTAYALNPRAAHVIGVDLGGAKVRAAIVDLTGQIRDEQVRPTARGDKTKLIGQLQGLCRELADNAGAPWDTVITVAVGAPGVVDAGTGVIRLAPNLPVLERVPLERELAGQLDTRIALENDVNMAALGEHWQGRGRGVDDFCFIAIGTGIGMGLILDGQLRRGARGAAGEIALLPLGADPSETTNRTHGPLQEFAAASGLARRYTERSGHDAKLSTLPGIFSAARAGDAIATELLEEEAKVLALAVTSIKAVADPALVVFGGGAGARPDLLERVERWGNEFMADPPPLRLSGLGERAALVGAIGVALGSAHDALFAAAGTPERRALPELPQPDGVTALIS